MTDFKQRIEKNDPDNNGYDAAEFHSLIEGSDVNRDEILEGLKTPATLQALLVLKGENNKNITEVIKESIRNNKPTGFDILSASSTENLDQNKEDFIELCFLGWVIKNKKKFTDINNLSDEAFLTKAKEYYKDNIETKEIIKEEDVEAKGTNEVATTTVTRNGDGLSKINAVNNISSAEINVEAGASSTIMSEAGAYTLFYENMNRLKKIKSKFKNTKVIDTLISELGGDKNLSELKDYKRITDIVSGRKNQYGNAILILARLTEGFIQSLEKIEKKAEKDKDKADVDLKLTITRNQCTIGNKGEADEDRYLDISGKVKGMTSKEGDDNKANNKTAEDIIKVGGDGDKKEEKKEDKKEKEKNKSEEKNGEEEDEDEDEDNKEHKEVLKIDNNDPRRLLLADIFEEKIDKVDKTGNTRSIGGYQGFEFSKLKETNNKDGSKTVTFFLKDGTISKGRLNYTVKKQDFSVTQNSDGSYGPIKGSQQLENMVKTPEVNNKKLGLPEDITVKNVDQNNITLAYKKAGVFDNNTLIDLNIDVDPLTGKLKYPTATSDELNNITGERVDITPSNINKKNIDSKYSPDGGELKFYARMKSDGTLEIINNLKQGDTSFDQAYDEYLATIEDFNESSHIFFDIYNSDKNESTLDKTGFMSGKSVPKKDAQNNIIPNAYNYEASIKSNSGANTYKISIPYIVNRNSEENINQFDTKNISIYKDGKKVSPIQGLWNIDGVFYQIAAKGEHISLRQNEATELRHYQEIHPNKENISLDGEKYNTYEHENSTIEGNPTTKALTHLPNYTTSELIRIPAKDKKNTSMEQEIHIADQSFIVNYDEEGALTYITTKDNTKNRWIAGSDNPEMTIKNYIGEKDLTLKLQTDKNGNVFVAPKYKEGENSFEDEESLDRQIYNDKKELYGAFENIRGVLGQDEQYFQFPKSSNIESEGGSLDIKWGEKDGKPRFKSPSPDRKGIYTVTVIESKNRWSNPNPKRGPKPDFELHFKRVDGKMKFVDLEGKVINDQKVKMPLEDPSDTKLHMNYEFSMGERGLEVTPIDKEKMNNRPFLYPGDEINIAGKPLQIQEIISSNNGRHKLLFSNGKIGDVWTKKEVDNKTNKESYKGYANLSKVNDQLKNAEGKDINTLFKDTLIQRLKTMDTSDLGYSKKVLKNYIATLGPDLELLNAIEGLSSQSQHRFDFVPLVVDNHLEMGAVNTGETIQNISKVKKRKLWDGKLEKLITQIAYLKKAEDISLDYYNSKGTTSGLFMYANQDTFKEARTTILSQGMNDDAVLKYKLSNGNGEIKAIKITMGVQSGERFTVTNNPIELEGYRYTVSYHKKTKSNGKQRANTITIDSAERINK